MVSITTLVFVDSAGYHFADYPTFLNYYQTGYQNIYGTDTYIDPDSQDGQWLAFQAQAAYDMATVGASIYNSFSPLTAQGAGLARVVKINGLTKESASFSTVDVTVVGTAGTVITDGFGTDTLNQQWNLPSTVTIPSSGSIDVTATAQNIGLVTAEANTITTIGTPTFGWQTINNAAAAIPGAAIESDTDLRIRQQQSQAIAAQTVFDATLAAVANVTGVSKTQGYENFTDSSVNGLPPHSICVVTVGGNSTDIVNAIGVKKTPGTNPFGNTGPFTYTDSKGLPVPIYYSEAVTAEIQVTVNVTENTGWTSDTEDLIKQAVADSINLLNIGSIVYPSSLYPIALLLGTAVAGTYYITSIEIGKNGGMQSSSPIALATGENAENPVSVLTDITVNAIT